MAADVDAKMFASAHHWRITESKSRACLLPTTDRQLDGGRDQRLRYRLMSDRCRNQRDIRRAIYCGWRGPRYIRCFKARTHVICCSKSGRESIESPCRPQVELSVSSKWPRAHDVDETKLHGFAASRLHTTVVKYSENVRVPNFRRISLDLCDYSIHIADATELGRFVAWRRRQLCCAD